MKKWFIGLLVGVFLVAGAWLLVSSFWRRAPLARIYAEPRSGLSPLVVTLANIGENPKDEELQFEWTLDGTVISSQHYFHHQLPSPGEYTITLKVTNQRGFSNTDTATVKVNPRPKPVLTWSTAGPWKDMASCVLMNEPADPAPWGDNYLCSAKDFGLKWSSAGPIEGMRCTQIQEPAEPPAHSWDNNYLCLPDSSPLELAWSAEGRIPEKKCIQMGERGDRHGEYQGWRNNYLCYTLKSEDVAQKQADSPPQ
jgi:hypothetical protein